MNYLKIYISLIRKAEKRTHLDGYSEKHHVFPQSLFGKNNRIVVLTAREHYIAHRLLFKGFAKRYGTKHYSTIKMFHAYRMMGIMKSEHHKDRLFVLPSRVIAELRYMNSLLNKGELNKAKLPENRKKISDSKKNNSRPDMKGKAFMGSSLGKEELLKRANDARNEKIKERKRLGMKGINARSGYKNGPMSEERKEKISQARKNTAVRWTNMSKDEFTAWLVVVYNKGTLYRKTGLSSNVSRALKARGENYEEYKRSVEH